MTVTPFAGPIKWLFQWFLAATDITVGYNWRFDGTVNAPKNMRPSFDIRNNSRSRTYILANIAYLRDKHSVAPFDNKSVWGKELRPGSIQAVEAAPVVGFVSLAQCMETEVHIRLQNGRTLKGQGPGQLRCRIPRAMFWLRRTFEKTAIPLE